MVIVIFRRFPVFPSYFCITVMFDSFGKRWYTMFHTPLFSYAMHNNYSEKEH